MGESLTELIVGRGHIFLLISQKYFWLEYIARPRHPKKQVDDGGDENRL